jgi:hypothetical protein
VTSQPLTPAELTARLAAARDIFPGHAITAERTADNRVRYTARSRHDGAHPRVLVTSDYAELHAALSASA